MCLCVCVGGGFSSGKPISDEDRPTANRPLLAGYVHLNLFALCTLGFATKYLDVVWGVFSSTVVHGLISTDFFVRGGYVSRVDKLATAVISNSGLFVVEGVLGGVGFALKTYHGTPPEIAWGVFFFVGGGVGFVCRET